MRNNYVVVCAIIFVCSIYSCVTSKREKHAAFGGSWSSGTKAPIEQPELLQNNNNNNGEDQTSQLRTSDPGVTTSLNPVGTEQYDTSKCDIILLNSGEEIYGKVTEITLTEVRYRACDNLDGPVIYISKSSVFLIKYPNGTKTIITEHKETPPAKTEIAADTPPEEPRIEGFGVIGTLLGLFALVLPVILELHLLLGLLSLAFGIYSVSSITKNPKIKKGMGFAILSLLLGLAILGLLAIILSV